MLSVLDLRGVPDEAHLLQASLPRAISAPSPATDGTAARLQKIRESGDEAIWAQLAKSGDVEPETFRISGDTCESALANLSPLVREALEASAGALRAFHREIDHEPAAYDAEGVSIAPLRRPVRRCGLVLKATSPSQATSILGATVAARLAGVAQVVVSVEPDANGQLSQLVLASAALAGVDEVFALGQVAGVGGLAFGTQSIEAVDVLCAEPEVLSQVGAFAANSPLKMLRVTSSSLRPMVVIDRSAPSQVAVGDVIAAASAGSCADVCVVAWDEDALATVVSQLEEATKGSDKLRWLGLVVRDETQAACLINAYRPDQVQLLLADPTQFAQSLSLDTQVFVGTATSPSVVGAFGGPGVLAVQTPGGSARVLTPDDFRYYATSIALHGDAFLRLASHAVALTEAEGDENRAESIRRRMGH